MKKHYYTLLFSLISLACLAQPRLVKDIYPGGQGNPADFFPFNGKMFFSATSPDTSSLSPTGYQKELWLSDGTDSGTYMVYDLPADVGGSVNPYGFVSASNRLFFIGEVSGGYMLMTSDGTPNGTNSVITASYANPLATADPANLIAFGNNIVLHVAESDQMNGALFLTNGTVPGTKRLSDFAVTPSDPVQYGILNNTLYLSAGIDNFDALTKTNGTAAGTQEVTKLGSSVMSNLLPFKNALYFMGDTSFNFNIEFWKTDGTASGTTKVKEVFPGNNPGNSSVQKLVCDANYVYFMADNGTNGFEIWRSDGTTAGTQMISDLSKDENMIVEPNSLFVHNNTVYFSALDSTTFYYSLWKTDGTASGTIELLDSMTMSISHQFKNYTTAGKHLIIADGEQLLISDGTAANSGVLTVCDQQYGPKNIGEISYMNGMVFMNVYDTLNDNELYVFDFVPSNTGTPEQIAQRQNLVVAPNPFSGEFRFENITGILTNLTITDITGREIVTDKTVKAGESIRLPQVSGIYFYHCRDMKGYTYSGKLVCNP